MQQLQDLVRNPSTMIVDVRTPMEYESGHINGAINIPVDQIAYKLDTFKKNESPVVVYCRSGARSSMAMGILQQNGIRNVYNGGGIMDMHFLLN